MRDVPDSHVRLQPFVRGQSCFVPAARGYVWNLRGPVIKPLYSTFGSALPVDVAYITTCLPKWPDARILSYLTHKVRFEIDLPLQIVLFP
eukprot:3995465-Pleurochrysis_carterae.AAC.2